MKNYIQRCLFAITFISLSYSATQAQVTGSYVPTYQQSQTQWCWATCGQMIYWAYLPGTISQCTFVRKAVDREQAWFGIGGCNNLSHSSSNVCTYPGTFNQPQSIYGCNGSLADVLDQYGVPSTSYGSALSGATLTTNLSSKKLMVARWGWNSGGGHALVINRYKNGYVYFNNPGNNSANIWTYSTFSSANGQGSWTHTLRMNNSAVYGTTYYKSSAVEQTPNVASEALSLNLYPNPSTDKINILLNGVKTKNSQLFITDAVGKVMFNQAYGPETDHVSLDVSAWSRGIYFVSLNGESHLTKTMSLR